MDPITLSTVVAVFLCTAITLFLLVVVLLWTVLLGSRILTAVAEGNGYVVASPNPKEAITTGPRKKISREGVIAMSQDIAASEADDTWQALHNI
jgi:hypothetical protein